MQVTAFSSLGSPGYVALGLAKPEDSAFNEQCVKEIAEKHGKSCAQVLLRWGVQRGIAIIPKSVKEERQIENRNVFDFTLDSDEMKALTGLNKNKRFADPGYYCEAFFNTFYPIYE